MMKVLLALMLLMPACSGPYTKAGGLYESPNRSYSFTPPEGWMEYKVDGSLLMTRDGPFCQYLLVQERTLDKPYVHTGKHFLKGMLPQEAAQVVLDEMRSDRVLIGFHLIDNAPAMLGGLDGFKLLFSYRDKEGLVVKSLYYGAIAGDRFFSVRFTAAEKDYFDRDLENFKKVLSSFEIKS
jgi:hypothetical protein